MKPGNPYGKDAFKYGSEDNLALRNLQAARAEKAKLAAPTPRRDPIPSPHTPYIPGYNPKSSVSSSPSREGRRGGGGLIVGLGKLIVIGFIALAVIGYFNSKPSGTPPETTPKNAPASSQADAPQSTSPSSSELSSETSTPSMPLSTAQVTGTAPATAPTTHESTSTPGDDPIGNGGFISPATTAVDVDVCVPPALVDNFSWDSPAPGSAMAAFKAYIAGIIRQHGAAKSQYKITDDAFDRFEQGRQSPNSYSPDPVDVIQTIPLGQPCPATNYTYTIPVQN